MQGELLQALMACTELQRIAQTDHVPLQGGEGERRLRVDDQVDDDLLRAFPDSSLSVWAAAFLGLRSSLELHNEPAVPAQHFVEF